MPESVQVGVLRVLTHMIKLSQEEKEHSNDESRLCEMQHKMSDTSKFCATTLIAALGKREDEVGCEAIQFGIELLHGGNPTAQDSLLQYLYDRGGLFPMISHSVQIASQKLKERQRGKVFLREQLFANPQEKRACETLLDREAEVIQVANLLRLLQLFCEGHHLRFQNYLRLQDHTSQSSNMVSEVQVRLLAYVCTLCICPSL